MAIYYNCRLYSLQLTQACQKALPTKPDVTKSYPQQYSKWYSMHGDERSAEHTALFNEWKLKVLRKIHSEVGGSADEAGQRAHASQPDGTSAQNRARARDAARDKQQQTVDQRFEQRNSAAPPAVA